MSHTKQIINSIIKNTSDIQKKTVEDNDLTEALSALNTLMEIGGNFSEESPSLGFYWNEITSEAISVLHSSISGYNRLAISGLRNILELSCHVFYYYDHEIELGLAINDNKVSDKYPSYLVRHELFFTTKYIYVFNKKIKSIQTKEDSVSDFIKKEYSSLCDVVHGRNNTLFRKNELSISYKKSDYKKFEKSYFNVIGIISVMYFLRFNNCDLGESNKFIKKIRVLKD